MRKIKYVLHEPKEIRTNPLEELDNNKQQFKAGYIENSDLSLAFTRWKSHEKKKGRILHIIRRKDTPLLYIIEIRSKN